jgi:hypothetical protein
MIRIEQPGMAGMYAATGAAIGKAKEKERQQQIEEEMAFRAQQRQAARDWEIEKMRLESEQQEAHRLRMQQAQLEKEARAAEWAVEKMEIASRIDFEREEMERQRSLSELNSGYKDLKDKVASGDVDGKNLHVQTKLAWYEMNIEATKAGVTGPSYGSVASAIKPPKTDPIKQVVQRLMDDSTPTERGVTVVRDKETGEIGEIPTRDVEAYRDTYDVVDLTKPVEKVKVEYRRDPTNPFLPPVRVNPFLNRNRGKK